MFIAIKSEMDSRVLLYPLMRSLKSYGSMLVVSSNRQLSRLIDDEAEGGFRNIRIIVEESGATDDVFEDYGIAADDFDFVILDNVGALEYDYCLIPLGARHSEAFGEDVDLLLETDAEKTKVIQFGRESKKEKIAKQNGKGKKAEDSYDPSDKFKAMAEERKNAKNINKTIIVPFPTFQDIETLEAEHRFYGVPANLVEAFFNIFKETLVVDKMQFRKEVLKKDERGGYIKSRDWAREE